MIGKNVKKVSNDWKNSFGYHPMIRYYVTKRDKSIYYW